VNGAQASIKEPAPALLVSSGNNGSNPENLPILHDQGARRGEKVLFSKLEQLGIAEKQSYVSQILRQKVSGNETTISGAQVTVTDRAVVSHKDPHV